MSIWFKMDILISIPLLSCSAWELHSISIYPSPTLVIQIKLLKLGLWAWLNTTESEWMCMCVKMNRGLVKILIQDFAIRLILPLAVSFGERDTIHTSIKKIPMSLQIPMSLKGFHNQAWRVINTSPGIIMQKNDSAFYPRSCNISKYMFSEIPLLLFVMLVE